MGSTELLMIRDNLDGIPEAPLPEGYRLLRHRPALEADWLRVQAAADELNAFSAETFAEQFGKDPKQLEARILYLQDPHGRIVGTSAAWFGGHGYGNDMGRIHWVAVLPEFQGRGLSKPLLAESMFSLKELGHRKAYLTTDARRPAAVGLYCKFGFKTAPS